MPSTAFDLVIVTAANEPQAEGYRQQIQRRSSAGRLEGATAWMVLADPQGSRVGSGAATMLALRSAAAHFAALMPGRGRVKPHLLDALRNRCVLVLHSGGDSRRLPAYAAQGKVFAPLPFRAGAMQPASLFDLLLEDMASLASQASGRVVIASGDVLLNLSKAPLDISGPGVVGVAAPGTMTRGSRHGVYCAGTNQEVRAFLQKPSADEAARHGAIRDGGTVLIDTGVLSIEAGTAARWIARLERDGRSGKSPSLLTDMAEGRCPMIDLYEHVLMALVPGTTERVYLDQTEARSGASTSADRAWRARLFRALRPTRFGVVVASQSDFVHIGSTGEFLRSAVSEHRVARSHSGSGGTVVYNSTVLVRRTGEGPIVVEGCDGTRLSRPIAAGGRNLVVGLPGHCTSRIALPAGIGMVCLPIKGGKWSAVPFGDGDDFKTPLNRGGSFLNSNVNGRLARAVGAPPGWDTRSLWELALWKIGGIEEVVTDAVSLAHGALPTRSKQRARRFSLGELVLKVDHSRIGACEAAESLQGLGGRLAVDERFDVMSVIASERLGRPHLREALRSITASSDSLQDTDGMPYALAKARLARCEALTLEALRAPAGRVAHANERAFALVREYVTQKITLAERPPRVTLLADQQAWASSPARIDLAGGWTDTPPISNRIGGSVVNAAITLSGVRPINAVVRLLPKEAVIRIHSVDLGEFVRIADTRDANRYTDPGHWASLPKAALVLTGFAPPRLDVPLKAWLARLGGGIELTVLSAIPKGSGLGTSSILGATILAALDAAAGVAPAFDSLVRRTSALEQMISTAGGWQDQAGGILPGVKSLSTSPGAVQIPAASTLAIPEGVLDRSMLYYTGYRRLAKNILQGVVGRFLQGDARSLDILARLGAGASAMKRSLEIGNDAGFVESLREYGELKRAIDAGSMTPQILKMIRPVERFLDGYELPGAGGGGFLFMVARSPADAEKVRAHFSDHPPNAQARFFDFGIDTLGLRVVVI